MSQAGKARGAATNDEKWTKTEGPRNTRKTRKSERKGRWGGEAVSRRE